MKPQLTLAVLLFSVLPGQAAALTFEQSFTLPTSIEYETNPRLRSNNRESVKRALFVPSYNLMATQNNEQFFADLRFNIQRSSNQSASADREDPNLGVGWTHTYETGQFGITANFAEQSTRTSEFDDSGQVINGNTRTTRSLGANWSVTLSDRYSLSVNLNTSKLEFDSTSATLNGNTNKRINSQLNYVMSDTLSVFARASLSQFVPDNNSSTNFRSVDLGATWQLSDNLSVNASGGVNETGGSNGSSGWQANIDTQYTTERSTLSAGLSRSRSPSSLGVIRENNQLSAGWSYNLSEKENIGLNLSYRENLGLNQTETVLFSTNYTRALSRDWDFSVSARYRSRDTDLTDASSNTVTATIIYKLPDF